MPIYEYRCGACGHELEALQKISDEPLADCPECAGALKRLISAPNFRLKGSGWYETDFKGDGDKKRNLADKGESTAGEDKSDKAKSDDTKTAAKGNGKDKAKTQTKAASDGGSGNAKPTDKSKPKPSASDSAT